MATCQIGISIYKQPFVWVVKSVTSALSQEGDTDIVCTVRIDGPQGCDFKTLSWLNDICRSDDRLILILGRNRIGPFASYNAIFSCFSTTYLCQLDADDWLENSAINESIKVLKNYPTAPFVYTVYQEVDAQGKFVSFGKRCKRSFSMLAELVEFSTFHLRVIQRWAYIRCGGYNPRLKYAGDYDLSLKLAELGQPEKVLHVLYNYRIHDCNSSILHKKLLFDEAFIISKSALSRRGLDHIYRLECCKEKNHQHLLFKRMGPILISGMHKSGTSLVALIMQSLGVEFGSNLLEPNSDNPDGYCEDLNAIKLNRLALTRLGLDPDWGELKRSICSENITNSEWKDLAKSYITSRAQSRSIWGWKDPRNSILLNEWMEVDPTIKVLAVFRSPWDVIESFSRSKYAFYPKKVSDIVEIWCTFNRGILEFAIKYPSQCIILPSSLIIESTGEFIERVNKKWEDILPIDNSMSIAKASKFVRSDKFLSLDPSDERVKLFMSEFPQAVDIYERLMSATSA